MNKVWIITKNNLKMIFRRKIVLVAVVLSAVLVVAALASAFHTLLDHNDDAGVFTVGYRMSQDSQFRFMEEALTESLREQSITISKYESADAESLIEKGEVSVFVDFSEDSYHIYGNGKQELQTRVVQYVLFMMEEHFNAAMMGQEPYKTMEYEKLATVKTSEAENYYGIIEIIYFASMCSIFLTLIFRTERKYNIGLRFRVGLAGPCSRYFGKLVPCIISSVLLQVLAETVLVTALFDVTIGKPILSIAILVLHVIAFAAVGMLFFLLFDNVAVSIGLLFMLLWFAGFVGGTFETYMYSSIPRAINELSPLYYVNRSLVELSVNGCSEYVQPCIQYLLCMTVGSILLGLLITAKKKEA